ncbi:MAG TPA: nickel-binding protein [Chryseolinea sp.]|nr:nickel-binding protein [Chryseolinea sp.]
MDLHKASDYEVKPTVEEIKQNHIADLAVQEKYGVRFIQYWINEDSGMVFCMMEAPDKDACAAVHQEAHGNMPCNVIELKGGDYETFMGSASKANQFDIVENLDGTFDNGTRTFVSAEVLASSNISTCFSIIQEAIKNFNGRVVDRHGDRVTAVFNSATNAVRCSVNMFNEIKKKQRNTEIQIGVDAGHPVDENDGFFETTLKRANRLCDIAVNARIIVSASTKELAGNLNKENRQPMLRTLTAQEERFLDRLLDIIEATIGNTDCHIEMIGKNIGMSRAQLYRKITSLTGMAPNNFLNELRLKKALRLLKSKSGNISEIAYEAGFSNPSYFTSMFQKRFNLLPSRYLQSIT